MGVIMKNKVNYTGGSAGGGGASALADLEDVELTTPTDGQALVYDAENDLWINGGVVGNGGGSAKYTETELWSGTLKTVNATASLSESIYNFDQIKILWTPYKGSDNLYHSFITIPVSDVIINQLAQFLIPIDWGGTEYTAYMSYRFSDNQTLKLDEVGNGSHTDIRILKVIGIKWETMQTALIYSEEEREVGVWTDGKPLYQKTVHISSVPSNAYDTIPMNISNIDKCVEYKGIVHYSNGIYEDFNYSRPDGTNSTFYTAITSNGDFFFRSYEAITAQAWVTIQYTKTTDIAGSGIWTTTGEYAHHYSTSEKVVGTWTDGKPLYERTIFTNPTWSNNSTSISLTNEICKSIDGGVCDANDENLIPFGYAASNEYVRCYQAGNVLTIYNSFTSSRSYVQITIRYTKTTD